jgi:hypothetical protein
MNSGFTVVATIFRIIEYRQVFPAKRPQEQCHRHVRRRRSVTADHALSARADQIEANEAALSICRDAKAGPRRSRNQRRSEQHTGGPGTRHIGQL